MSPRAIFESSINRRGDVVGELEALHEAQLRGFPISSIS